MGDSLETDLTNAGFKINPVNLRESPTSGITLSLIFVRNCRIIFPIRNPSPGNTQSFIIKSKKVCKPEDAQSTETARTEYR